MIEKEINYQAIAEQIERLSALDQETRDHSGNGFDSRSENNEEENIRVLKDIVDRIGWPTISMVGRQASHNMLLLVLHADKDRDFQKHCLDLMESLPEGETSEQNISYLRERIRHNEESSLFIGGKKNAEGGIKDVGFDTVEEDMKRSNNRPSGGFGGGGELNL